MTRATLSRSGYFGLGKISVSIGLHASPPGYPCNAANMRKLADSALYAAKPATGEFKDQAKVRLTAEHFANLDDKGELGAAFGPPKGTDEAKIAHVQDEEGWILGV